MQNLPLATYFLRINTMIITHGLVTQVEHTSPIELPPTNLFSPVDETTESDLANQYGLFGMRSFEDTGG